MLNSEVVLTELQSEAFLSSIQIPRSSRIGDTLVTITVTDGLLELLRK